MSTVRKPRRQSHDPCAEDPYFYGYRDVDRVGRNGRKDSVMVPLTPEDVLHPQEGDHITQNAAHWTDVIYLHSILAALFATDPGTLVLSDAAIFWDLVELRHHAPDIAVIFGVRRARRYWPSFRVADEGVRPTLIIEVTSPSTRAVDFGRKRRQYFRAKVPYYVIADEQLRRGQRTLRLLGYRRGLRGYERLALNSQGRLWLEPVGLWLGQADGRIVCYDAQGNHLGDYTELSQAKEAAERARVEAEQARADLEQKVKELEAELRRARGNGR